MRILVQEDALAAASHVAHYIAQRVESFNPTEAKPFVLALTTGTTMISVYEELIRLVEASELSFKHVTTFNVDEFVGLPESSPESYHNFMWTHLFKHIDIVPENVYILNGNVPDLGAECRHFEESIERFGGIELCLGGIGVDGHFGFNEPGSSLVSRTRVKTLAHHTIMESMTRFGHVDRVPKQALTMGVGTVLDAREVLLVICGEAKAIALQKCLEEGVNHMWTVSCLQNHPRAVIVCDEDATVELRVKTVRYFKGMQKTMSTLVAGCSTSSPDAMQKTMSKRERNLEQGAAAAGSPVAPSKRPRDR